MFKKLINGTKGQYPQNVQNGAKILKMCPFLHFENERNYFKTVRIYLFFNLYFLFLQLFQFSFFFFSFFLLLGTKWDISGVIWRFSEKIGIFDTFKNCCFFSHFLRRLKLFGWFWNILGHLGPSDAFKFFEGT